MFKKDKRENIIMIASEPLTFEKGENLYYLFGRRKFSLSAKIADWMEIKTNNMIVITPKMNVLQIPIIDKYYVQPSHPDAALRNSDFAQEKGYLNPHQSAQAVAVH